MVGVPIKNKSETTDSFSPFNMNLSSVSIGGYFWWNILSIVMKKNQESCDFFFLMSESWK